MNDVTEAAKGAFEAIFKDIREKVQQAQGETGLVEDFSQFAAAVQWTEPWLLALLGTEVALLICILVFRKATGFQGVVFFLCAGIVKSSESINSYLATQWEAFATQPYFDPRGVFISAVLSVPLVLIMFVILINYLVASASLLVTMKRKELLIKACRAAREESDTQDPKKEK
eukprot:jgi/Tetstr1/458878/TSEL_004386.t1